MLLFSILDIIAGIALFTIHSWASKIILGLGIFFLLKGIYYMLPQIEDGTFLLEWMNWIDIIVGIFLIFKIHWGYFAVVPIIKGIYCLALARLSN